MFRPYCRAIEMFMSCLVPVSPLRWCGTSTAATCWVVWIVPTALSRAPGRSIWRVHSLQCHGACELGWKSAGEAAGLETDAFPLGAEQSLGGQLLGPLLRSHFFGCWRLNWQHPEATKGRAKTGPVQTEREPMPLHSLQKVLAEDTPRSGCSITAPHDSWCCNGPGHMPTPWSALKFGAFRSTWCCPRRSWRSSLALWLLPASLAGCHWSILSVFNGESTMFFQHPRLRCHVTSFKT